MPFRFVYRLSSIDYRPARVIRDCRFTINDKRLGYSLIELLVVIAIFGITISLVTASYLTFERNQRFKNAALQLKNDIRYAQNQALTGVMGVDVNDLCPEATRELGGWYLSLTTGLSAYQLNGVCLQKDANGNIVSQTIFGAKTINFPKGVKVSAISGGASNILFQPLGKDVTFHTSGTPPFFNADGTLRSQVSIGLPLTISLDSSSASGTYNVVVQSTGEVNENKCPTPSPC